MGVKRKQHKAEFKARVAMASLSGEKTLAELSAQFGVHPMMISNWKQELVKRAGELFERGSKAPAVGDAQKVIDAAVQLHGGLGVTVGAKVEELYREIRALRIYEGASEVQRQIIARDLLKEHSA